MMQQDCYVGQRVTPANGEWRGFVYVVADVLAPRAWCVPEPVWHAANGTGLLRFLPTPYLDPLPLIADLDATTSQCRSTGPFASDGPKCPHGKLQFDAVPCVKCWGAFD